MCISSYHLTRSSPKVILGVFYRYLKVSDAHSDPEIMNSSILACQTAHDLAGSHSRPVGTRQTHGQNLTLDPQNPKVRSSNPLSRSFYRYLKSLAAHSNALGLISAIEHASAGLMSQPLTAIMACYGLSLDELIVGLSN